MDLSPVDLENPHCPNFVAKLTLTTFKLFKIARIKSKAFQLFTSNPKVLLPI